MTRLSGQAVIVTGAGGGIGGAISHGFAAEGAAVIVADLGDGAAKVADAIRGGGGRAVAVEADVTRMDDMTALAGLAVREHGRLDVLVTCAGLGLSGLLAEQEERDWLRIVDVNLNGTYRAIRAALPQMMVQRRGRIVTIASILGKMGGFGYVSAYAASKHGVVGLTRAVAAEMGSQGFPAITVNAVCPGYTRAGMGIAVQSTKAGPRSGEEIFDRYYKRQVAQRRMLEPEEIAQVAVFLALPESAAITGQALNVDGGFVMS
jgi:NAD(P)-dependent dehydrogenase (short-subunit alcohol dehydrogenase family)